MKISNVNYSHTQCQAPNFKGKVGKRFNSYLKDVQKDVLKTKGLNNVENVEYAERAIRNIQERLNPFMAKTSKDIQLTLTEFTETSSFDDIQPHIVNMPVFLYKNTEIDPFFIGLKDGYAVITKKDLTGVSSRKPHHSHDLCPLDDFSKQLVEKFTPEQLEKALKERAVIETEKEMLEKQEQLQQKEAENKLKSALKRLKNVFK